MCVREGECVRECACVRECEYLCVREGRECVKEGTNECVSVRVCLWEGGRESGGRRRRRIGFSGFDQLSQANPLLSEDGGSKNRITLSYGSSAALVPPQPTAVHKHTSTGQREPTLINTQTKGGWN